MHPLEGVISVISALCSSRKLNIVKPAKVMDSGKAPELPHGDSAEGVLCPHGDKGKMDERLLTQAVNRTF